MTRSSNTEGVAHQAWLLMCDKNQFTRREIADALGVNYNLIIGLTRALQKQAAIEVLEQRTGKQGHIYRVIVKHDAPTVSIGRPQGQRALRRAKHATSSQQIWNSIRINNHFTKHLIMATTTVSPSWIAHYLAHLTKAGYIRVLNSLKDSPRGTCLRYMLVRNSGRLCPTERPDGMWDHNSQTFYPFQVKSLRRNQGANQ